MRQHLDNLKLLVKIIYSYIYKKKKQIWNYAVHWFKFNFSVLKTKICDYLQNLNFKKINCIAQDNVYTNHNTK